MNRRKKAKSTNTIGTILTQLVELPPTGAKSFPERLLFLLRPYIAYKSAAFFSYCHLNGKHALRKSIGTHHDISAPIYSDLKDLKKKCKKVSILNPRLARLEPIQKYLGCKTVLFLPLEARDHESLNEYLGNDSIGCVIIGFSTNQEASKSIAILSKLDRIVSNLYLRSVMFDKLKIRNEIINKSFSSPDLSSLLHKTGVEFKNSWNVGSVSIYIMDQRTGTLVLRSTTGLIDKSIKKHQAQHTMSSGSRCIEIIKTSKPIVQDHYSSSIEPSKYQEDVGEVFGRLYVPILLATRKDSTRSCIGVLKVTNLYGSENREKLCFGWEDIVILEFLAGFISACDMLYTKADSTKNDVERSIHGIQTVLQAVSARLHQLNTRSHITSKLEPTYKYHVSDSLAFLEGLLWQISRLSYEKDHFDTTKKKVEVYGDVLSKLITLLSPISRFFSTEAPQLTMPRKKEDIERLHPVNTNADSLNIVFRNLIENSIKYSKPEQAPNITISWEKVDENVVIKLKDDGIGIPDDEACHLFTEGFRGETAMKKTVSGTGLGLYQCKKIMNAMDGDLSYLQEDDEKTTFAVSIPIWRGQ